MPPHHGIKLVHLGEVYRSAIICRNIALLDRTTNATPPSLLPDEQAVRSVRTQVMAVSTIVGRRERALMAFTLRSSAVIAPPRNRGQQVTVICPVGKPDLRDSDIAFEDDERESYIEHGHIGRQHWSGPPCDTWHAEIRDALNRTLTSIVVLPTQCPTANMSPE
jgi:hypothetical protein